MSQSDRVSVDTVDIGRGGDRILRGDLYLPPKPNGAGLLLIHGGGFVQSDRSQLRGYGIQLGRLGYTSLACEYRLPPGKKKPAAKEDGPHPPTAAPQITPE